MRRWVLVIGAAALAALVTMTACSSSSNKSATSGTSSAGSSAASTSTPATSAHNQADVTFAQNMIPHHEQHCIQMSDIILGKQGIDPRVVQLANQIKAEQGPEIQQMRSWLSQWGQPTISMAPGMAMSRSGHDCLAERAGCGRDARQFLTGMIQEHQGSHRDGPGRNQVRSVSAGRGAGPLDRPPTTSRRSPPCKAFWPRCRDNGRTARTGRRMERALHWGSEHVAELLIPMIR